MKNLFYFLTIRYTYKLCFSNFHCYIQICVVEIMKWQIQEVNNRQNYITKFKFASVLVRSKTFQWFKIILLVYCMLYELLGFLFADLFWYFLTILFSIGNSIRWLFPGCLKFYKLRNQNYFFKIYFALTDNCHRSNQWCVLSSAILSNSSFIIFIPRIHQKFK